VIKARPDYLRDHFDQFGRSNGKRVSQFNDIDEAHIALAALDSSDVIAMEISQLRKLFMR
jgi:hypothetical protein